MKRMGLRRRPSKFFVHYIWVGSNGLLTTRTSIPKVNALKTKHAVPTKKAKYLQNSSAHGTPTPFTAYVNTQVLLDEAVGPRSKKAAIMKTGQQ